MPSEQCSACRTIEAAKLMKTHSCGSVFMKEGGWQTND
jgi:hypothetical protein